MLIMSNVWIWHEMLWQEIRAWQLSWAGGWELSILESEETCTQALHQSENETFSSSPKNSCMFGGKAEIWQLRYKSWLPLSLSPQCFLFHNIPLSPAACTSFPPFNWPTVTLQSLFLFLSFINIKPYYFLCLTWAVFAQNRQNLSLRSPSIPVHSNNITLMWYRYYKVGISSPFPSLGYGDNTNAGTSIFAIQMQIYK